MPEVGYQEVHLARAFARTGHTVKVFTSTATVKLGGNIGKRKYAAGLFTDEKLGYEILRLPALSYKSKAFSNNLTKSVKEFNPDLLVILGVAKVFPAPLLNKRFHDTVKMVSLYGDAKEYFDRDTFAQKAKTFIHESGFKLIKKPLYLKAVKYCHKIILNIPETDEFFQAIVPAKLKSIYSSKKLLLNLGFDPDEYYFNESDRQAKRKELGIAEDETVLITSTRINKRKSLEQVISLISKLNEEGKKVRYILVGFMADAYEKELKAFIEKHRAGAFICFPFLGAADIRKIYCAADAGIWLKAAISIQEAMGTGLPVILEDKPSVNHLITDSHSGWFYQKNSFAETIRKAVDTLQKGNTDRKKLAEENAARLSYDSITKKIISSLHMDNQ